MKSSTADLALGIAVVLGAVLVVLLLTGFSGLLYLCVLGACGLLAIPLWKRKSLLSRVVAVVLMPVLLWSKFLGKDTQRSIERLKAKNSATPDSGAVE